MPLAFDSISHGEIAFGFFNIDTDMVLLEHYFLFADQFCAGISKMARAKDLTACRGNWDIYDIQPPEKVGDLMGAIHGIRYSGFIGAVYQRFPFPVHPEDFKQQPDGHKNREFVVALIEPYAVKRTITVAIDEPAQSVSIGEYRFTFDTFGELVRYIWRGGYPQWKQGKRPGYVIQMRRAIGSSRLMLFSDVVL